MTFEQICEEWRNDAVIDQTNLAEESLKISQLHSKYWKIYVEERVRRHRLKDKYKLLALEKFEFYTTGGTKEQFDMGWRLPPKGMVLKNEADKYIEADPDIQKILYDIALLNERVSFLEDIIKNLNQRSFNIKNAIEFIKWTHGQT